MAKQPPGRPPAGHTILSIGFDPITLACIEQERALTRPIPPRTAMIRRLMEEALDARRKRRSRQASNTAEGE